MGNIVGAFLTPHPPIIMKEIGRGEEKKAERTINSMELISKKIALIEPDTIVVITPHGPVFQDAITIGYEKELYGDMKSFGYENIYINKENSYNLAKKIIEKSKNNGIPVLKLNKESSKTYNIDYNLDHGVQVPLYFIEKEYKDYKLLHITYGLLSFVDLYRFGMIIQSVVENSEENVVVIASGDLSHKLLETGPYNYHPDGPKFDKELLDILESGDYIKILDIDKTMRSNAAECGLRAIEVLLGSIDGYYSDPVKLSYEGPFGVGYGIVDFNIGIKNDNYKLEEEIKKKEKDKLKNTKINESIYVKLARQSLNNYIKNGEIMDVPEDLPRDLIENRAGVFVSIHKDGNLRGCIGTISPYRNSVADEIIHNAISAGTKDYRFSSIRDFELDDLEYSVDVLMKPEKIDSIEHLDIKKYGVIVTSGSKRGLLLPNLDGINSIEEQVEIAKKKAGIDDNEVFELERFEVIRYK